MLKLILQWLSRTRRHRRLHHDIRHLDERMLRDIGLTRDQIF